MIVVMDVAVEVIDISVNTEAIHKMKTITTKTKKNKNSHSLK